MIMTRARPVFQKKTVKCPFCRKGDIEVTMTLDWYSEGRAHSAGRSATIPQYYPEGTEVHNKCANCGKSKKELKETIERGQSRKPAHKELLERLRRAGLPTVIES